MSDAAQAVKTSSRTKALFLVVLTFVVLGPAVGGFLFGLVAAFAAAWANSGGASVLSIISGYILFVLLSVLFAYLFAIPHALIAGVIVAAAGIWKQWNSVLVAFGAGVIASVAGTIALQFRELGTADPFGIIWFNTFWFMPSSLLAALVCWYITRSTVRATWNGAETAR